MSKYMDQLLREWADWCDGQNKSGLGFPSRVAWSVERTNRSTETMLPVADPDILRIDAIMSKQPCPLRPMERQIIWMQYRERRYRYATERAKAMGISRNRYYEFLASAQTSIESLLNMMKSPQAANMDSETSAKATPQN